MKAYHSCVVAGQSWVVPPVGFSLAGLNVPCHVVTVDAFRPDAQTWRLTRASFYRTALAPLIAGFTALD